MPDAADLVWNTVDWTRSPLTFYITCHCDKLFRGRDLKRVVQHYKHHSKHCTSARKELRRQKQYPKLYGNPFEPPPLTTYAVSDE